MKKLPTRKLSREEEVLVEEVQDELELVELHPLDQHTTEGWGREHLESERVTEVSMDLKEAIVQKIPPVLHL